MRKFADYLGLNLGQSTTSNNGSESAASVAVTAAAAAAAAADDDDATASFPEPSRERSDSSQIAEEELLKALQTKGMQRLCNTLGIVFVLT
jgi:hypothetical protein